MAKDKSIDFEPIMTSLNPLYGFLINNFYKFESNIWKIEDYTKTLDINDQYGYKPWVKISGPGIIVYLERNQVVVKTRTKSGGYKVHNYCYGNYISQKDIDKLCDAALRLVGFVFPKPNRPKRSMSAYQPRKWDMNCYDESGPFITVKRSISACQVACVVSVTNNLKVVDVVAPNAKPWFLIDAKEPAGRIFNVVTDTKGYYIVSVRTNNVSMVGPTLYKTDKELIMRAIKKFSREMK